MSYGSVLSLLNGPEAANASRGRLTHIPACGDAHAGIGRGVIRTIRMIRSIRTPFVVDAGPEKGRPHRRRVERISRIEMIPRIAPTASRASTTAYGPLSVQQKNRRGWTPPSEV
jgi:hypothetical protein